ncbi:MAG: SsrA-binding protein SmpB [Ardenticatenaceae bacterium]
MSEDRTITVNRKARFEYDIADSLEAGLVLTGSEIKAIREGRVNLSDAYARPHNGEMWLHNAHIAQYSASGPHNNHEPKRPRKLLLRKEQISELTRHVSEKGRTIVPLKLYITRHVAKVELGLATGRKKYDKRRAIMDREREREAQQAIRR